MNHFDFQMTANTYKIEIKVLDIALKEPKVTQIEPDARLKDHTCPVCELITHKTKISNELLVIDTENHYQLIVPKISALAQTLGYKPGQEGTASNLHHEKKKEESKQEMYTSEESNTEDTDEDISQ
jgi:hypothetical protein